LQYPSPDEIIRIVKAGAGDDLKGLWKTLHVSPRERILSEKSDDEGTEEFSCWTGCDAKVVSRQRLLENGRDELVRVCGRGGTECRFLLLHRDQARWTLIDYIDSWDNKYDRPEAGVIDTGDRRWLVIDEFGGGGTGVSLQVASWHELHNGRFRWVLGLADKGRDLNADPERKFSSRFLRYERTSGKELLRFAFVVNFQTHANEPLWQDDWKITYSRVIGQPIFQFDSQLSGIAREAAQDIFHFDSLELEMFTRVAFAHLIEIARNPSDPRRTWLREFLEKAEDIPQLKTIRKEFEKR
jgi:hypothetical protein